MLLIVQHALLAYFPDIPEIESPFNTWPALRYMFYVNDGQSWDFLRVYVYFNDSFWMSTMFFLSGLFVWRSLQKRGNLQFLKNRITRLGIPFVFMVLFILPLTFYPTYAQVTPNPTISDYLQQFLSFESWPVNHSWFVWLLLAFDLVVMFIPGWVFDLVAGAFNRDWKFYTLAVLLTAVAYLPMNAIFGPYYWTSVDIFTFQSSRILHYLVYFLLGVAIGKYGISDSFLRQDGVFAKRWYLWLGVGVFVFLFAYPTYYSDIPYWSTINALFFIVYCGIMNLAVIAAFIHFVKVRPVWLANLEVCAFGIYIIHTPFVSWVQYGLLDTDLHVTLKFTIAFIVPLLLSWGAVNLLRRNKYIAQIV